MRIASETDGARRRFADALPVALLACGWLALIVYAYPGMMTMDSIDQLTEARAGFYTDSHPPAMSMLWRWVDRIYPGPLGMLLLQSVGVVVGLYVVLRRALAPVPAAAAASLLLVFPPIFTPLAVIWKDCLMAAFLLLATAGLTSERRGAKLAALVACVAATAVRYNAPAATLPLIVILFTWSPGPALRRYALAAGAWVVVTVTALGVGTVMTDQPMHIWHSSLALHDIAGTLSESDGTRSDDELRTVFEGTQIRVDTDIHSTLRRVYSPKDFATLIGGEARLWDMPIAGTTPAPAAQRDAVERVYTQVLSGDPFSYLAHRAAVMQWVLALTDEAPTSTVMNHRLQYPPLLAKLGLPHEPSALQWAWQKKLSRIASRTLPSLYRPWIYAVLALALLAFCHGQRDVFAILLSGIGLEASLFLLAASPDYRYSHWLVVCTCIAVVMLVARRMDSVHKRRRGEELER